MLQSIDSLEGNTLRKKVFDKVQERENRSPMADTRWMNQRITDLQNEVSALIDILNEEVFSKNAEKKK